MEKEGITSLIPEIRQLRFWSLSLRDMDRLAVRLKHSLSISDCEKLRIAVLGNFLTDFLVDSLRLMLVRRGIIPEILACSYGQMVAEILTNGPTVAGAPAIVLVLPTHRDLRRAPSLSASRDEAAQAVIEEARFWGDLLGRIRAPVVMLSFDPPPLKTFADGDAFLPGGLTRHVRSVNLALADNLSPTVALIDSEALHAQLGPGAHDSRLYTICKQPFSMEVLPRFADALAAGIVAHLGRARKVLVLDLDNTLWGGVVGDVGLDGLVLGVETPEGEAFVAFQLYIKRLHDRGIILAVCSKNNDYIARSVFRNHPAMVLREADIACFVANFDDKASNIRIIQKTLNVGLDALVFLDDNPVERAWVAQQLPEVTVIDLPDDPADYAHAVEVSKVFPLFRVTREDFSRNASYKALALLQQDSQASADMETFLQDLQPILRVEAVDDGCLQRIVQLISKTNQFKLNAQLFTPEEIRFGAEGVLALRLSDRLQDYGIVAVAVTRVERGCLVVLNWVMSCRVFGRRLENAMHAMIIQTAIDKGCKTVLCRYAQSPKNAMVPSALVLLGFKNANEAGDFMQEVSAPIRALPHYMEIRDLRKVAR